MDSFFSSARRSVKAESTKSGTTAEITMDPRGKGEQDTMSGLSLGALVPDFGAESTQGHIDWHKWIGDDWVLFLSYPQDFCPVSTTELAYLAKISDELEKRQVKLAVVSSNSVEDHHEWVHDVESTDLPDGKPIAFPLMSDTDLRVADAYGMLDPQKKGANGLPLLCRASVIIGPDKRVKYYGLCPGTTGRNMTEFLRIIDSIQNNNNYNVLTPVNWAPGDLCVVDPSLSEEELKEKFGKHTDITMRSGRNYLKFVNDPSGGGKCPFSWAGFLKAFLGIGSGIAIGIVGGKYIKPVKGKA